MTSAIDAGEDELEPGEPQPVARHAAEEQPEAEELDETR